MAFRPDAPFALQEETMTPITPTIRFMTPEETRTNRLINAGSALIYGTTAIPLGAGRSDRIHSFKESTVLYVLSTNSKLGYMGLEIFDASSGEEYEQIFLQYEWELEEYLGKEWEQMEPVAIVRKLVANLF
jgi:hypothetical protein